ncbi:hypothetical protein [Acidithiobacillus ferridurans]|uniref:Uncharacterized protein n=1 Tax=Acidithiobacillus ferridurans TaxID=1232575 RepID=A0A8X8G7J0_ACIFI|nr:hypothetical protein [Acidithiobacillus ferridurans]MBU2716951.1 hypothetical protein [Acidithiobacillus ferridurans]MBU2721797.1 hypothetical protein [Acidithiobacillus ferridurans]MBU2725660.1 hypothetical protein [Acidithiobacillus ferridurans]
MEEGKPLTAPDLSTAQSWAKDFTKQTGVRHIAYRITCVGKDSFAYVEYRVAKERGATGGTQV